MHLCLQCHLRWLLATFLAGWYGDVDPIEESDDDNDGDDASWLYGSGDVVIQFSTLAV